MKRLSMIFSLMLMTSMIFAQGINFEADGTTLKEVAAKAKKEGNE